MERKGQKAQSSDHGVPRRDLLAGGAALAGAALLGAAGRANAVTYETVLIGSFASTAALEANWNYLYPWGSDHNGTARMYKDRVSISGGVLTLTASRLSSPEGTSSHPPNLPINYHSGAIHAKHQITVNSTYPHYEVGGNSQAPTSTGCWPAFWLTGVQWPPEADTWMASATPPTPPPAGSAGRCGSSLNLQMEAVSGTPGPSSAAYRANGVWIGRIARNGSSPPEPGPRPQRGREARSRAVRLPVVSSP